MAVALGLGIAIGSIFMGNGGRETVTHHEDHAHEPNAAGEWTCSMHPQVRQSGPGACPFCGMDLIPVENSEENDPAVLKMSKAAMQLANIQTTEVRPENVKKTLRLNGRVMVDERRIKTQTTHFGGRIEVLYKDFTGDTITRGQKVASLYSPELLAAQEELIEAKKLENTNPVLLQAARKKLRYWKLSDAQVKLIEDSKEPMRNFDLLADFSGVITAKMVKTGDHLQEGDALLQITDLSTLWVVFEVYEKDLSLVQPGDVIRFSNPGLSEEMEASISFISPRVNPKTRIVQVRGEVNNQKGLLKPEMFVSAKLSSNQGQTLLVPKSAVLWTGKRSVVYVQKGNQPEFELREIITGSATGAAYQVLEGLESGEKVVTNGAFTLDAEAQLRGKTSMMNPAAIEEPKNTVFEEVQLPAVVNWQALAGETFKNQLMELSMEYLKLKDLMVAGNGRDIRKAGVLVKEKLAAISPPTNARAKAHWQSLTEPMKASLNLIITTGDRDAQRLQFINLSKALINAIQSFGTNDEYPLYIQFCPMANNNKGAAWVSREKEIINPYFGDAMLHCGRVEKVIK